MEKRIVPMSVQMLIENAIKHNIISHSKPLTISISTADSFFIIQNNLQKKSSVELSSGIGLQNIKKRYEFLTTEKMVIEETPEFFMVKIPLL
jgi:LytS/YehU family sensor histidine kinase